MIKRIVNRMIKRRTENLKKIPIVIVTFDWRKYQKEGPEKTCGVYLHPELGCDMELAAMFKEPIEYIRANYDMEKFTKI